MRWQKHAVFLSNFAQPLRPHGDLTLNSTVSGANPQPSPTTLQILRASESLVGTFCAFLLIFPPFPPLRTVRHGRVSTRSASPDPRSSRRLPPLAHGSFARPQTLADAALHTRQQTCVPCDRPHMAPTLPRTRLLHTVPLTGALVGTLRILHLSSTAPLCTPRLRLFACPCSQMP